TIDGKVYSIGGVTPDGFPSLSERPIDVWLPLDHASGGDLAPRDWRNNRGPFWLAIVGRLSPDTSRTVAEQQASAMLRNRRVALGDTGPPLAVAITSTVPGRDADKTLESKVSLWLAGVSAFVLLIACANVSNLVLARAIAQRREYFIRLTLGASRWALIRRSLSDTCVIVIPGMVGALGISFLLRNSIWVFLSGEIPLSRHFWDARSVAIMAGSAALAFLLVCGVSVSQLRSTTIGTGFLAQATYARNLSRSTRRTLLAVQAALCVALLFVAGLFATSLGRVESLDLGVDLDHTIHLTINLGPRSRGNNEIRGIYERAHDVLAKHPDVERVTLAEGSPYMSGRGTGPRTAERSFADLWTARDEVAYRSVVGTGFFSTVGSHSLRGRDFNDSDRIGAEPVAIINAPLARYLWPSKDAIGECIWLDDTSSAVRIVGVLGGVWKFSALKRDKMAVYLPLGQIPDAAPRAIFIRPRGDARRFLAQARSIVQSLNPDLPAAKAVLVRDVVDPEFRPWRLGATVFSAFAVVALVITSIGLYGVVTVNTALRLQEIGIRMALGARWPHVLKAVVGEGMMSVAGGLFAGAVLVMLASRKLSGVLFETSPRDPAVLIQTAFILLMVSAVAMILPTIRALRTNP
ncbi:MAG: FtsX-like permease family protein, partial [Phyllobacteriaceae bacterium]|nr:FtsX-like permease family protein [Phyllobacteriaceae bacterium]